MPEASNWNCSVHLDDAAKNEMIWVMANIDDVSGFTIKVNPSVKILHFQYILHGDASGTGMYLGMIRNQALALVREPFTEEEAAKSSTYREIKVFYHFFTRTNLLPFRNSSILQFTDNKSAEHILTFGSRNSEIQEMVHKIVIQCRMSRIQ